MDRKRIRDELTDIALEEDEAEVYLTLLELGTSKARTVAEETDIHRTTAYRILKDLGDRGLVEVGVGRPMEFTPAPPERLFEELRREKSRELERVDEVEQEVVDGLRKIRSRSGEPGTQDARWRMIKGREAIVGQAVEVLGNAQEELRYLSTNPMSADERDRVDVDWEGALQNKLGEIDIRILLDPDPLEEDVLEVFRSADDLELRYTDTQAQAQSILIDGQVFVWVVVGEEVEDDVALWSDAPDLYTSQRLLFDALWEGAKAP